ncbi:TetR/AcrR family transcriptional regulator [Georgenia subflava]|uniref:TetR family transcriptional regulator n=1 Tax=Georgenia subflava TaxID=1622177 RepID=A0A6N7ENW3_9MICO|nr:TetR family transcriptional regulator [Georgenia subflava]MPV38225.1 TetR family transcriptional regulator [Georgenia subflava]
MAGRTVPGRSGKGARRRTSIVEAAAATVLAEGPEAVTHRAVAERAGCSLSATTYYFSGLDDLLGAAGSLVVTRWVEHAEKVRDSLPDPARRTSPPTRAETVAAVTDALLPESGQVRGHYQQLLSAGGAPAVAKAYGTGRARLDAVVDEVLARLGSSCPPALAVAVVDGAVVSALSEGRDVRRTVAAMLEHVL